MKLTILGGAAAGGNTGMGCSGYLIESAETRLVVDLGPGTLLELRKHIDFRTLSAVIISHWHVDHYLDLAALRFALAYNPVKTDGAIPLYMPPGGAALLSRFGQSLQQDEQDPLFFGATFDVHEFEPQESLTVGSLTIRFIPTIHFVPCWAMRIEDDHGSSIGYTADTGPLAALMHFFAEVDLLVAEATDIDPPVSDGIVGHLTAAQAGELATKSGAKGLIVTHMWEENGFNAYEAGARALFGGPIHLARPGLSLNSGEMR